MICCLFVYDYFLFCVFGWFVVMVGFGCFGLGWWFRCFVVGIVYLLFCLLMFCLLLFCLGLLVIVLIVEGFVCFVLLVWD